MMDVDGSALVEMGWRGSDPMWSDAGHAIECLPPLPQGPVYVQDLQQQQQHAHFQSDTQGYAQYGQTAHNGSNPYDSQVHFRGQPVPDGLGGHPSSRGLEDYSNYYNDYNNVGRGRGRGRGRGFERGMGRGMGRERDSEYLHRYPSRTQQWEGEREGRNENENDKRWLRDGGGRSREGWARREEGNGQWNREEFRRDGWNERNERRESYERHCGHQDGRGYGYNDRRDSWRGRGRGNGRGWNRPSGHPYRDHFRSYAGTYDSSRGRGYDENASSTSNDRKRSRSNTPHDWQRRSHGQNQQGSESNAKGPNAAFERQPSGIDKPPGQTDSNLGWGTSKGAYADRGHNGDNSKPTVQLVNGHVGPVDVGVHGTTADMNINQPAIAPQPRPQIQNQPQPQSHPRPHPPTPQPQPPSQPLHQSQPISETPPPARTTAATPTNVPTPTPTTPQDDSTVILPVGVDVEKEKPAGYVLVPSGILREKGKETRMVFKKVPLGSLDASGDGAGTNIEVNGGRSVGEGKRTGAGAGDNERDEGVDSHDAKRIKLSHFPQDAGAYSSREATVGRRTEWGVRDSAGWGNKWTGKIDRLEREREKEREREMASEKEKKKDKEHIRPVAISKEIWAAACALGSGGGVGVGNPTTKQALSGIKIKKNKAEVKLKEPVGDVNNEFDCAVGGGDIQSVSGTTPAPSAPIAQDASFSTSLPIVSGFAPPTINMPIFGTDLVVGQRLTRGMTRNLESAMMPPPLLPDDATSISAPLPVSTPVPGIATKKTKTKTASQVLRKSASGKQAGAAGKLSFVKVRVKRASGLVKSRRKTQDEATEDTDASEEVDDGEDSGMNSDEESFDIPLLDGMAPKEEQEAETKPPSKKAARKANSKGTVEGQGKRKAKETGDGPADGKETAKRKRKPLSTMTRMNRQDLDPDAKVEVGGDGMAIDGLEPLKTISQSKAKTKATGRGKKEAKVVKGKPEWSVPRKGTIFISEGPVKRSHQSFARNPIPRIWTGSKEELASVLPELAKSKLVNGISWGLSVVPTLLLDTDTSPQTLSWVSSGQNPEVAGGTEIDFLMIRDFACHKEELQTESQRIDALSVNAPELSGPLAFSSHFPVPGIDNANIPIPKPRKRPIKRLASKQAKSKTPSPAPVPGAGVEAATAPQWQPSTSATKAAAKPEAGNCGGSNPVKYPFIWDFVLWQGIASSAVAVASTSAPASASAMVQHSRVTRASTRLHNVPAPFSPTSARVNQVLKGNSRAMGVDKQRIEDMTMRVIDEEMVDEDEIANDLLELDNSSSSLLHNLVMRDVEEGIFVDVWSSPGVVFVQGSSSGLARRESADWNLPRVFEEDEWEDVTVEHGSTEGIEGEEQVAYEGKGKGKAVEMYPIVVGVQQAQGKAKAKKQIARRTAGGRRPIDLKKTKQLGRVPKTLERTAGDEFRDLQRQIADLDSTSGAVETEGCIPILPPFKLSPVVLPDERERKAHSTSTAPTPAPVPTPAHLDAPALSTSKLPLQQQDLDPDVLPSSLPSEVQVLVDSYVHATPIIIISSRQALLQNWDLAVPSEFAYFHLGYFKVTRVWEERVHVDADEQRTKAEPEPGPDQDHTLEEIVHGRVKWRFRCRWMRGGEYPTEVYPQHHLERPWWIDPTPPPHQAGTDDESTLLYRLCASKSRNHLFRNATADVWDFMLPTQVLPPTQSSAYMGELVGLGGTCVVSDEAFPRGWWCERCGRLNQQYMMRHRECLSLVCRDQMVWKGYALPLEMMRESKDTHAINVPYSTIPKKVVGVEVVRWSDHMQTLSYDLDGARGENGDGGSGEGQGRVVKHIFTGNLRELQVEATQFLTSIQEDVKLRRPIGDTVRPGSAHATPADDELFWSERNFPECLNEMRDLMKFYAEAYVEKKDFEISRLFIIGAVGSGSRKGIGTLDARRHPVVVMCLGNEAAVSLVPKSGFKAGASVTMNVSSDGGGGGMAGVITTTTATSTNTSTATADADAAPVIAVEASGSETRTVSDGSGNENQALDHDQNRDREGALPPMSVSTPVLVSVSGSNLGAGEASGGHILGSDKMIEQEQQNRHQHQVQPVLNLDGLIRMEDEVKKQDVAGAGPTDDSLIRPGGDKDGAVSTKAPSKKAGVKKADSPPFVVSLVHGDMLMLFGEEFEYSIKRVGTTILAIGSRDAEVTG
ncbi:hypothetical protein AX16_002852 [Volvariella volvacea WC 439]|nr:hypothetical protein AX16_002852 [Volvariella volvacea WC 439]